MPIKTGPENDFQPSVADLNVCPDGARAVLMNSPNNPTGTVYSDATMGAIADYVQRNDLTLISDEVYDTQIRSGRSYIAAYLTRYGSAHDCDRVDVQKPCNDR
jgi:arginine:pyruvate transaminase